MTSTTNLDAPTHLPPQPHSLPFCADPATRHPLSTLNPQLLPAHLLQPIRKRYPAPPPPLFTPQTPPKKSPPPCRFQTLPLTPAL